MTVAGGGAGRSPVCPSSGPRRLGWLSSGARGAGCRRMRGIRSWRRSVTRLSRSPTSGCPGLPSALSEIPLEVAVEGADELRSHGVPGRVGIVGMSRGSELHCSPPRSGPSGSARLSASRHRAWSTPATDQTVQGAHRGGRSMAKRCRTSQGGTPSVITVENILGPVVTLVGADDQVWPSSELIAPAMQRRQRSSHDGAAQVVFEGAGHQFFG